MVIIIISNVIHMREYVFTLASHLICLHLLASTLRRILLSGPGEVGETR